MNFCRKCQSVLEDGRGVCPKCFAPVHRGFLGRVWDGVKGVFGSVRLNVNVNAAPKLTVRDKIDAMTTPPIDVSTRTFVHRSENIRYEDTTTGEKGEWSSWDDVPESIKAKIRQVGGGHAKIGDLDIADASHISVLDSTSGTKREFSSIDELPEDIRTLLRDMHVDLDSVIRTTHVKTVKTVRTARGR